MLLLAAVRDRLGPDVVRTGVRLHSFTQRRSSAGAYTQGRATGTVTVYEAAVIGAGEACTPRSGPTRPGQLGVPRPHLPAGRHWRRRREQMSQSP